MKMEINDSNVLLARFEKRMFFGYPIDKFGGNTGNRLPDMYYHEDWNWLMPVCRIIVQDKTLRSSLPVDEYFDMARVVKTSLMKADIQKVYSAVVAFIKFYNSQNKQDG